MGIITLISDWGTADYYVAAVKGKIYSEMPTTTIVDITHEVPHFDKAKAAFILKNVYPDFPEGSVHIIGVSSIATEKTPHLIIEHQKQFFICADNNIPSLLFDDKPDKVYRLNVDENLKDSTFPERDIFVPAACKLLQGEPVENLGQPTQVTNIIFPVFPSHNVYDEYAEIRGIVVYIDGYGNLMTNIAKAHFEEYAAKYQKYVIMARSAKLDSISDIYYARQECDPIAVFASNGFLQIVLYKAFGSSLLGMKTQNVITIRFFNEKL